MGTDRFETLLLVAKLDGLARGKPEIDRLGINSAPSQTWGISW
jgi:hypothetical protein